MDQANRGYGRRSGGNGERRSQGSGIYLAVPMAARPFVPGLLIREFIQCRKDV
jgi:hypothetical protein